MKQPGEELQETLTELEDQTVADYLVRHPDFFIRNARLVEQMRVPHAPYATPPEKPCRAPHAARASVPPAARYG